MQILTPVLGIRSVVNLVPAEGGSDPETAQEIGFEAPITGLFERLYAQAVDHGLADLDHSALFVELASRNGMA